ncbi:hypothetical protein EV702DRAFT_922318, partial [Suillus placidus]
NGPTAQRWDILAFQEACEDRLRNTKSNRQWHTLYPTQHFTHPEQKTRAITLISTSLNTNDWQQISFPSSDVVVVQFSGPFGKCTLFNIYNDSKKQDTIHTLE